MLVSEMGEGAAEQRVEAADRGRRILETEGAVENMRRRLSAMGFLEADGQSGVGIGSGSGSGVERRGSGQATTGSTASLAVGQGRGENVAVVEAAAHPQSAASPVKEKAFSSAEAYRRARRSVTEIAMPMRQRPGSGVGGAKGGVDSSGDKPPLTGGANPTGTERGGAADRNACREAAAASCSAAVPPALAEAGQVKRRGSVSSNNRDGAKTGTGEETRRVTLDTVTPSPSPPSVREEEPWRPSADRESWAPPRSSSSSLSSFSSRRGGGGERAEAKHSPGASRPSIDGVEEEAEDTAKTIGNGGERGGRQDRREGLRATAAAAAVVPGSLSPTNPAATPTTRFALQGKAGGEILGALSGITRPSRGPPPTCEQGTLGHGVAADTPTSETLSVDVSPVEGNGDGSMSSRGGGTPEKGSDGRPRRRRRRRRGLPTPPRGQAGEGVDQGDGGAGGEGGQEPGGREQTVLPRPDEEYEEALLRLTAAAAHAAELYRELAEASATSAATGGTGTRVGTGAGTGDKRPGAESFASRMPARLASGSPEFRESEPEPTAGE